MVINVLVAIWDQQYDITDTKLKCWEKVGAVKAAKWKLFSIIVSNSHYPASVYHADLSPGTCHLWSISSSLFGEGGEHHGSLVSLSAIRLPLWCCPLYFNLKSTQLKTFLDEDAIFNFFFFYRIFNDALLVTNSGDCVTLAIRLNSCFWHYGTWDPDLQVGALQWFRSHLSSLGGYHKAPFLDLFFSLCTCCHLALCSTNIIFLSTVAWMIVEFILPRNTLVHALSSLSLSTSLTSGDGCQ